MTQPRVTVGAAAAINETPEVGYPINRAHPETTLAMREFGSMRVDLKVPYKQKQKAKRLGAKWDATRQIWYLENPTDLKPFKDWVPRHLRQEPQEAPMVERWWDK